MTETATGWPDATLKTIRQLKAIEHDLCQRFVERDWAVRLLVLATLCREHLLLIGPPGTAKTELVTRFGERIMADAAAQNGDAAKLRQFTYLLTRFTEPSELFGPLDLKSFDQGIYRIRTDGMLPTAHLAFLDEVFEGSSAILNTLLTLVNERVFYNGSTPQRTDLISLIGASNRLPEDPALAAFGDRFMLRIEVEPVSAANLSDLVDLGLSHEIDRMRTLVNGAVRSRPIAVTGLAELTALSGRIAEVDTTEVRATYEAVVREIVALGAKLSDRRIVKGLKLVAGAALLDEADVASARHLWPLSFFWTDVADAEQVRQVVQPRVEDDGGKALERCRDVDEILENAEAEAEYWLTHSRRGATDAALVSSLHALNRLRIELLRCHPLDEAARSVIDETIAAVMDRFGDGADGREG